MRASRWLFASALAPLLLTGCVGGSTSPALPGSALPAGSAQGRLTLRVLIPQALPLNVTGIRIATTAENDGSTYMTSAPCSSSGCTVNAAAGINFVDVTATLTAVTGATVESGSLLVDIPATGHKTMRVAFGGVPANYFLSVEPADLLLGAPGSAKLSLIAREADSTEIIGTMPLPAPIVIAGATAAVTPAATQFTAIGQTIQIAYDGSSVRHVRFTGTAAGAAVFGATLYLVPAAHLTTQGNGSGDARAPTRRRIVALPTAPPVPPPLGGRLASAGVRSVLDLGAAFPPIGDQGASLACSTWSSSYAIRSYFAGLQLGWTFTGSGPGGIDTDQVFSPEFAFAALDGGVNAALNPTDVLNFITQYGAVTWTQMPFSDAAYGPPPTAAQLAAGAANPIYDLGTISDLPTLKTWLAGGYPIWWIAAIDDNFEYLGPFGVWNGGGSSAGAHALVITGYDDTQQRLTVRNSWGPGWGTSGSGYVTYAEWQDASIMNVVLSDQP